MTEDVILVPSSIYHQNFFDYYDVIVKCCIHAIFYQNLTTIQYNDYYNSKKKNDHSCIF